MLLKKINVFHLFIAMVSFVGVSMQLYQYGVNMLLYFTTLSNIAVSVYYLFQVMNVKKVQLYYGNVVMAILLTGVVYHFMLSPLISAERFHRVENYIVHYIVPISVALDFFMNHQQINHWKKPFEWTVFPLIYFVFAIVNGLILKWEIPNNPDSPFPYFFLNVTKLGVHGVVQYALIILIVYILFGYLLMGVKKLVSQ
ncbi:Pr6Pr family membrane protein [Carnobacteriaceae bacterium zg-C25]|nr:Pr6Pr family membrane protein [Carnobacteriaceae bacterium zg-C25]